MPRADGGLRPWGCLLLLGLCIWTRTGADAPNPVGNLTVEARNNSSITLSWAAPEGPGLQNYTYWIQYTGEGGKNETRNTTDTRFTEDGLEPMSLYNFYVWAEKDGVKSPWEILNASTAPNPVRNLTVETRTNSSITLSWAAPEGPGLQNYTYWVQCTGESGKNETRNTTDTRITVEGLEPASLYNFYVWAEKDGAKSSWETLNASTAPNPIRNLTVEARTNSSITLSWAGPEGPGLQNYTYWVQHTREGDKNETQNTTDTRIIVDRLEPTSLYNFYVWAEKDGAPSSQETLNASTAPNPVRNLILEARTNSSITLSWAAPEGPGLQNYTYWVQCTGEGGKNETQNTTDTRITVDGLEPASLYNFYVWAEKNGALSSQETLNASTVPNPVTSLRMEDRTNSSITLSWTAPQGPDCPPYTYWVQWLRDDFIQGNQSTSETWVTVENLDPGTQYIFTLWAQRNGVMSENQQITEATVPNPVMSLRMQDRTNSSITLNWTSPQGPDRPPYTYWVQWVEEGMASETQNISDTGITVKNLNAGSLYTFSIWAMRNGISSKNQTLTEATVPNEVTDLKKVTQTNNSVSLKWNPPEDPHSQLYIYQVQWARKQQPQKDQDPQGDQANQTEKTNETWYVVEALEPGTLYNFSVRAERDNTTSSSQYLRASTAPGSVTITSCVSTLGGYGVTLTWSCPQGGYENFILEVGSRQQIEDRSSCGKHVSMSGLQPARSYPATIRTTWDGIKVPSASMTCYTESAGVIAGAVVGVLLFLVLVGLLIFFLKRRKGKSQEQPASRKLAFSFPGDILAEDFADHVRRKEKDSNYGFAEEYQQLALEGYSQPQAVASAPENRAKNRYRNVLPYDWSRVPLEPLCGELGSDYINASFMPGLWSTQEFIAAQGPLPQTVGDFWRMVWEQRCHTLVMLTNCMESGRVKCEHYWPLDAQPCTHGHLQVVLVGEEVQEHWTVRDLQLFHMEEQKTLSIRQFHYVAWPDHGVPQSPDPLLAFWKMLRQWLDQSTGQGPPIVHCSAGVGRTGTLIALDVSLRQLECEGLVGPFNFVKKMRESRPLMVQTEAQYVFLHQCILRFLQQAAPVPAEKGAACKDLLYENIAAIRTHEWEA